MLILLDIVLDSNGVMANGSDFLSELNKKF